MQTVSDPSKLPPRWERTPTEFDDWAARATERLDPFMAWLGLVFALLVGFDIAAEPGPATSSAIEVVGWMIWGIFATEFGVKLWLAPKRVDYLRTHWWQPILLLLPFLRVFSFLRLARVGRALPTSRVLSSSYRAAGTARYVFRSRLAYLGGLAIVAALAVAELAYLFERDHPDGVFPSFGDAAIWSTSAVLALQADPVPTTVAGRLTMLAAFAVGLVLIASLAGTIGSFLIEGRGRDRREG
ncbi:MAG: hypothetical protein M3331_05625 [Actinomycetota bacterium]|nr:hypothetical protein [Actinomycetota bacterium]